MTSPGLPSQGTNTCPYRKLDSSVAMMESGDHGLGNDSARPLNRAASRCILPKGQVRASLVVVPPQNSIRRGNLGHSRHLWTLGLGAWIALGAFSFSFVPPNLPSSRWSKTRTLPGTRPPSKGRASLDDWLRHGRDSTCSGRGRVQKRQKTSRLLRRMEF